jgi:xylan 1,4-beta-xylosidase
MTLVMPNPLLPGFHPDPSVVQVGEDYYLATSSFEYLPGIPLHHSRDLVHWTPIGHVVTRPGQLQMHGVFTGGGAWAPTIRWHDGVFHLVVADAGGRGMLLFTATDPAGPWSDGLPLTGIPGIDPDIAWDEQGTCFVTFSGLILEGPDLGTHLGIQQVRMDLSTGSALEAPRSVWSGTGLIFPEAPHLYRIGSYWYLMIAEGGTERGHAISIARSANPDGPFEGCPANPLLSARSTARPVQNTGHGDLVQAPDGSWHAVLLGMRVKGQTRSFAALGRETYSTSVEWVDDWPVFAPVELNDVISAPTFSDSFADAELGPDWVTVRRVATDIASWGAGALVLKGDGRGMDHPAPTFVGRRQSRLDARITATLSGRNGVGGLTIRYDEQTHYDLEVDGDRVVARACIPTMSVEHVAVLPAGSGGPGGPLTLVAEMREPERSFATGMTCDLIHLGVETADGTCIEVGVFDGRYLAAEVVCSFTGRVAGMYCVSGELSFSSYGETGLS